RRPVRRRSTGSSLILGERTFTSSSTNTREYEPNTFQAKGELISPVSINSRTFSSNAFQAKSEQIIPGPEYLSIGSGCLVATLHVAASVINFSEDTSPTFIKDALDISPVSPKRNYQLETFEDYLQTFLPEVDSNQYWIFFTSSKV
ncbi:unnamed protein product, partial [Meganyctiphanes norvegica]